MAKKKIKPIPQTTKNPLQDLAAKYSNLKHYDFSEPREEPVNKGERWERQEIFIDCYITLHGHITRSCEEAKIARNTFYIWCREDPEFVERLQSRKLEWESQFHAKAAIMAMNGHAGMIKFLLEFLNPYYDSAFRTKALEMMQREAIADKYPIPQPTILPPKIPERFRELSADNSRAAKQSGNESDS